MPIAERLRPECKLPLQFTLPKASLLGARLALSLLLMLPVHMLVALGSC